MPSRLPLFPLDVVLFPGEPLPLHIFEPRYRQLLADCLEGDERFGLTTAKAPGAGAIGTVARIRGTQPLADGRSNIVVVGERRFGIRTVVDEGTPYPVAMVEEFGDLPETAPLPTELAELRRHGIELAEAIAQLTDRIGEPPDWSPEAELFTFQVAALLEADLDTRTRLLAGRSTRDRTRTLLAVLPAVVHQVQGRADVHVRARGNGKGHPGADLASE